ncbi:MAG: bifunctional alpha,alpha-trehalose-phosphate synthase (UDP-forming)/trehalose-phosphatase [Thermodesulfobacteriota bacterium]|nr:MAG: bifunctional alpha,alpha-trehalose-phosphate synthase (UDP-forming)/trehalose-phosphatase [Thermodesulfobacteriota bacterium]
MGGLVTGVSSLDMTQEQIWIGWPGITLSGFSTKSDSMELKEKLSEQNYRPVFLKRNDFENYYQGFCNEVIWPLFHYFAQYANYQKKYWDSYKRVNEAFSKEVLEVANDDDVIWIHDYHLMLLPGLIRKKMPKVKIGFFLHIPFPSSEIFRLIPWCAELLDGLLGSDLIGFHTFDYARHFLESVRRVLGYEHTLGQITLGNHAVKVDTFPMGIDYEKFSHAPEKDEVQTSISKFRENIKKDYKVILSIDRLDYTKGIPERLEAFDYFLDKNPNYKGKVIFIVVAVPSRIEVEHYRLLKEQVDNLAGRINGKHGTIGWTPILYMYRSFDFVDLIALYSIADVLFLTPLRDGMNLVAKEYVAARKNEDGVLILGEMAGTAKELGEALIINPNDLHGTADALKKAITMPADEQKRRMISMRGRLKRYDVKRWAHDFMDRVNQIKEVQRQLISKGLSQSRKNKLLQNYQKSKRALFLLDYDGTLMPFNERPEKVKPDRELKGLLGSLCSNSGNHVVVISGRDRKTLDKWVSNISNALVAEHGVWIKEKKSWETLEMLSDEWKAEIRPILEVFVDRTPGSFIEEKDFSLVWHFRKVDPALAIVRLGELKDVLLHITANLNVGVLEGNKVVEVKDTGINKGKATMSWLAKAKWDFILSIGDDWTDEDIFEVLPEWAYSIKVGFGPTKARFNLPSYREVRKLLKDLIDVKS